MDKSTKIRILCAVLIVAVMIVEFLAIGNSGGNSTAVCLPETEEQREMDHSAVNSLDISSNRYARPEEKRESNSLLTLNGFQKLIANDELEVWIREDNFDIRVVDLQTEYIWGGIEEEQTTDLNKRWKKVATSLVVADYLDKQLKEGSVYSADEATEKTYRAGTDTVDFHMDFTEIGLSFDFSLTLCGHQMILRLNDSTICEDANYSLSAITFLPFFGAARLDDINGYFLLPDGSGALMRFTEGKDYISNFSKRIYGKDLGIERADELNNISDVETRPIEFMIPQQELIMPLFGVTHGPGENAFLSEITNGAVYSYIQADAAAPRMNYHYVRNRFVYRETYVQPTSQNGTGVQIIPEEKNRIDPEQTYTFLNGAEADYTGMASAYRKSLIARGELKQAAEDEAPSARLKVMTAVRDKGFITNETLVTTSVEDLSAIIDEMGQERILYTLDGWLSGGYGGYNLNDARPETKFSDLNGLEQLALKINQAGSQLLLQFDPIRMTDDQYRIRTDVATRISQQPITSQIDNEMILFNTTNYRKVNQIANGTDRVIEMVKPTGIDLAVEGLGSILYSDYQKGEGNNRDEALNLQQQLLASSAIRAISEPKSYTWKYMDIALDIPCNPSQYLYVSDSVPFLQLVLHGSAPLYGTPMNEDSYSSSSVLRLIEYGMLPSFTITQMDNYSLRDSALYGVYSSRWDVWEPMIRETVTTVEQALAGTQRYSMISHKVLWEGLTLTEYENGTRIYVNYTTGDLQADGYVISAESFLRVDP